MEPSPTFSFQGVVPQNEFEFSPYKEGSTTHKNRDSMDRKLDAGKRSPKGTQFALQSTDGHKNKLRQDFQSKIHRFLYSKNSDDLFAKPQITQSKHINPMRSSAQRFNKNQRANRDTSKNTNNSIISKGRSGEINVGSSTADQQLRKVLHGQLVRNKGPHSPLSLKKSPQNFSSHAFTDNINRLQSGRLSTRVAQTYGMTKQHPLRQSQALVSRNQMHLAKKDSSQERLETRDSTHDKIEIQRKRFARKGIPLQQKNEEKEKSTFSPLTTQDRTSLSAQIYYQQQQVAREDMNYKDVNLDIFNNRPMTDRYLEISLPSEAVTLILMFNANEITKLLRLSASWHTVINEALEEYTNGWENQFIKQYGEYLIFTKSYFSTTSISFCSQKGIRLDRVFQCEIQNNHDLFNKTVKIGYDFGYVKKKNSKERYHCEHRFDVIKPKLPRVTWIHQSHDLPPYSQNEIQMAPGDTVELAVSILNLNGLVDLSSFKWNTLEKLDIPKNDRDALNYDRDVKILFHMNDRKIKIHCNTNRICEVEDAVPEWIVAGKEYREQPKLDIDIKKYLSRFDVLQVQFNELDQHYNKIILQAKKKGLVESEILNDTLFVEVVKQNEPVQNEIKQKGMMFDRNTKKNKVQIRVGDILVLYNTLHMPQDLQPKIIFPDSLYASKASSGSAFKQGDSQYATQQSRQI